MKICPLCGKANKDKASICSECGFGFSGTEHIPGGKRTQAPTEKKRSGKALKIAALCLAVIIILGVAGAFVRDLRTMKWHRDFDPAIVISEGDILLYDMKRPSAKPFKIARLEGDEEISRQYQKIYLSKDRGLIVFSNSFEFYDEFFSVQCDVCSYDLEALPYFPKTELRNVVDWTVGSDGESFTYEMISEGRTGLYQRLDGEEKLVTDKYKVYSVSADGRDIAYSNKGSEAKLKVFETEDNIRIFALSELLSSEGEEKITFSLNGAEVTADLPEAVSVDEATLTVTEKGSALISDKKSGRAYLYRSNRFVSFSQAGEYTVLPDYPKGEMNVVKYDFSVLAKK